MNNSFFPHSLPPLTEKQLEDLLMNVKDYQLTHGSLLKLVKTDEEHTVLSRPVGVSLFPSQFPRSLFNQALHIQHIFNELYVKVAEDEEWLYETLQDLIGNDQFTGILWSIHEAVKKVGYVQTASVGIFRSDYMIHLDVELSQGKIAQASPELKQVEFNSYTVAGGTHGNIIALLHRHLHTIGAYGAFYDSIEGTNSISSFPHNRTIAGIVDALTAAHKEYGGPINPSATHTGILMIVSPYNFNICDERPIEFSLWEQLPLIPCYRLDFGEDILQYTSLGPNRELLYSHPSCRYSPLEISVCYMRTGHEPREYVPGAGYTARLRLEESRAIKAPSLLSHLTTFKKVQQRLALPGEIERFLSPEDSAFVRATFMPMYPMDTTELGIKGRDLAENEESAKNHVLKPSLEGGGHNVYAGDIPRTLKTLSEENWKAYILMELIKTPPQNGMLISPRGAYEGPVVSELGVFGTCLWRKKDDGEAEIQENNQSGWSFKTKPIDINEMSVVKGYGCFDSPFLVDI
jgi:glutathione synthase